MRFHQNGPSIPDELLTTRDEGRVVFFCGAGVSNARAKLSGFLDLVEEVIRGLGVPTDNVGRDKAAAATELDRGRCDSVLLGFAANNTDIGAFAGEIRTPNLDALASRSLLVTSLGG